MAQFLNQAAVSIASSTDIVGEVVESVFKVNEASIRENPTTDFSNLVVRMMVFSGAKPTPLECFVGLVTKQNAKGSTKA